MAVPALAEGGEEIRFAIIEAEVIERAGAENLRNLSAHEFAGGDFTHLIANRNTPASPNEFFNIVPRGMVGDAAHRSRAAFRQRDIQDARRLGGVLAEHLVKVPEPEKQNSARGQFPPEGVVLLHHRRKRFGRHSWWIGWCARPESRRHMMKLCQSPCKGEGRQNLRVRQAPHESRIASGSKKSTPRRGLKETGHPRGRGTWFFVSD